MIHSRHIARLLRAANFAGLLGACLLVMLGASSLLAEDPTGDLPFHRVHVPQANLRAMAQGHMPLEREQFEEMIESLRQAAAKPPGLATPIPRAVYHALLKGNQLSDGRAVWQIEPTDENSTQINLSDINLPILDPHWNANPAESADLGWAEETGLVLLAPQAGNLNFGWSRAGESTRRALENVPLSFEFHLPPASRTTLLIDAPQGWELRAGGGGGSILVGEESTLAPDPSLAILDTPPLAEGWRRWRIDVADATNFEFTAVPLAGNGPRSVVLLNQFTLYRFAESHVELRCELRLDVHNQPRDQLVLELDPRLSLTAAQLANTPLEWHRAEIAPAGETGEASSANLVVLDLPEPLADGQRTIELTAIAALVTGEPWALPTVQPRDVFWQQSQIELQVEGNLELAQLSAGSCQQVETSFTAGPHSGERHKFLCAAQRDEITLVLRRRQATIHGDTASRLILGPTTMRGTLLATLSVERGLAFEVRGTIPASWHIEEIEADQDETIEYWEIQPSAEGEQALLVRLREPLRAGTPLDLVLRGERRMPDTRPFALSELRMLELPAAETGREVFYVGAEPPSRPALSSHALPVETVSQPADVANGQLLGIATGDLTFQWQDFVASRVPPQLELKADPVRFSYNANVTIRVQDDVLHEQYAFACSPESAEVSTLLVQFNQAREMTPTWTLEGEAESAISARKLSQQEQEERLSTVAGEVWEVQLRRPRQAPFRLEASRSVPRREILEVALAALPEATPQSCEVRVLRETAEEMGVQANPDLVRIPLTPPVEFEYPNQIAAYRYQPERDVIAMLVSVLSIADAEDSLLQLAWIRTLRLETLAFEGERIEHRVHCEIENYGARQLAFRLPPGVQLAELLVDGQPLPDAVSSDPAAETMLALPVNRRIVAVEFRLIGQSANSFGRQRVTAPLPQFESPVLDATWTLWCPPGREVLGLSGLKSSSSLLEPDWRRRLFGPLARSEAPLETNNNWADRATMRRQVEWLLEDLEQAETKGSGTFWGYLAQHVKTPPAGETTEIRLPVLIDRATLTEPLAVDPEGSPTVLKRLGLAIVVHPQALILTDLRCDWLSHDCLESGGRSNVWEISCNATLADVAQAIEGSTRFVPLEQWNAELAAKTTAGSPITRPARLAPAGWTAHWFELPTEAKAADISTAAILYRPASVQWLGWLGLLVVLPLVSLLCSRVPAVAAIVVGVLGAIALVVPAWLVPITSLTLLGAFGGIVFWLTWKTPQPGATDKPKSAGPPRSTASLQVPSTIGTAILFMLITAWALSRIASAQEPAAWFGPHAGRQAPGSVGPPPESARIIDPITDEGEPSGDYVYVPELYYQELFRRTARLAQEPNSWMIHTARYAASPAEQPEHSSSQNIEILVNYEIETLVGDTTVTLPTPLRLLSSSTNALRVDGRPRRVQQTETGEGLAISLAIPGRHRLELTFTLPIKETRNGRVATLPIPPLAAAQLEWISGGELAMPEQVFAMGGELERDPTQLIVELGPVAKLELHWPPAAVELAGTIQAEQIMWLNVKPESVVADTRFHVDASEQEVTSLRLSIDRRLQLLPLAEASLVASNPRISDDGRELVLEFKEPLRGKQTFDLSFQIRDALGVGELHLPRVELLGAGNTLRAVGVSLAPSILYVSNTGENLQSLDTKDFVTQWGSAVAEPQRAFELSANGDLWSLATQRRQSETVGTGQIDFVCGAEYIDLNYQLALATTSGVVFQHRLQLPPELEVEELRVTQDGREQVARWTRDHHGLLTAYLLEPISGAHELTLRGRVPVTVSGQQVLPIVMLADAKLANSILRVYRGYDANVAVVHAVGVEVVQNAESRLDPRLGKLVREFRVAMGSGQVNAAITPNNPEVTADSDLILEPLEDGSWQVRWRCFLNVANGQLDAIRLLAPASWEGNVEVSQECQIAWSGTASPDRRLLTIFPSVPWHESSVVELTAPLPPRPSKPVEAPQVTLLEVAGWEARIVVPRHVEGLELSWDLQNMRSVALPLHSAAFFGDLTAWNAYEAMSEPYKAAHRTGAAPIGVPEVRLADIYVWWQEHGEGHGVARFDLLPSGNLTCLLRAPAHCEIVAARVEGVPVNLGELEGNLWELELSSPQLPQRIEIVFQGRLASRQAGRWSLIAPTLASEAGDLQVGQTLWTVVGPTDALPHHGQESANANLQRQQMARVEALSDLIQDAESTALALPRGDTANWYALWARRLAMAQRELMLAPPMPEPLSEADRNRLAAIDQAQFELAKRLEIDSQRKTAVGQAARLPSDAPRWISLGHQLRPSQRYMFEGTQSMLQWDVPPPTARHTMQQMLALAVWLLLAVSCWALVRGAALAGLAARWSGLLVVLAGVLWTLWLAPFWLGVALILLGLWAAVRGERPPVLRRHGFTG